MKSRAFKQVDVFSATPYMGNPLAVVLDGGGLSDDEMQRFARWTNLSETTFLLPPRSSEADYQVRIFTASREVPFAGHPTLGSCHAWLEAGGMARHADCVVQECAVGLVTIRQAPGRPAFAAPPLRRTGPVEPGTLARIARGLGIAPGDIVAHQHIDNGISWIGVMLGSAEQVLALTAEYAPLEGLELGVIGPHPAGHECQFEVRAFIPEGGMVWEDPVTGSLNAGLAQWLIGAGIAPASYVAAQGTAILRAGRVHLDRDPAGQVWVGGDATTLIDGKVSL